MSKRCFDIMLSIGTKILRWVPGGGYLVYFADGMCTPFRVSILPLFSNTGYQIRALFLKPVAKREILQEWGCFLRFGVYFSAIFSKAGHHW